MRNAHNPWNSKGICGASVAVAHPVPTSSATTPSCFFCQNLTADKTKGSGHRQPGFGLLPACMCISLRGFSCEDNALRGFSMKVLGSSFGWGGWPITMKDARMSPFQANSWGEVKRTIPRVWLNNGLDVSSPKGIVPSTFTLLYGTQQIYTNQTLQDAFCPMPLSKETTRARHIRAWATLNAASTSPKHGMCHRKCDIIHDGLEEKQRDKHFSDKTHSRWHSHQICKEREGS